MLEGGQGGQERSWSGGPMAVVVLWCASEQRAQGVSGMTHQDQASGPEPTEATALPWALEPGG